MQSELKEYLVQVDRHTSRPVALISRSGTRSTAIHSRGSSTRESSEERKGPKARVGGVLATYGQFIRVTLIQGMTRERRRLEKSLHDTQEQCEKLQ